MSFKPRRTKSLRSLQHSSNRKWPWEDDNDTQSNGADSRSAESAKTVLFTLPSGISVRQFRRSDATAVQQLFDQSDISTFFADTWVPRTFSLWQAHKFIDEHLDKDESWRPQFSSDADLTSRQTKIYEDAVNALAESNLDERLRKQAHNNKAAQEISGSSNNPSRGNDSDSTQPTKDVPKLPIAYTIVDESDTVIGMIDLGFEDPQSAGSESRDNHCDPAFLHDAELSYVVRPEHRNRGIATAVVREFLTWTWQNFAQLERITAAVFATWNPPSSKVLLKNGFSFEGRIPGGVRKRGQWGVLDLYGILRPGGQLERLESQAPQSAHVYSSSLDAAQPSHNNTAVAE